MAITFNPDTGIVVEDTATIRARLVEQWQKAFAVDPTKPLLNTETETPAGQLIDGQAILINQKDSALLTLANQLNPKTAAGVFQDALANIYFLTRHVAQPTYVTGNIKGAYGTIIPYGALVQDVNGYTFLNTTVTTIDENGTATAVFRCTQYGPIEVGPNTLTKIITAVPGWDSITNDASGVTGRNNETQAEFEQRRAESVSKNAHGTAAAVQGAVSDLDGVVACEVVENRGDNFITKMGVSLSPHSLYISVYGGEPEDIGNAIHQKIDGGCGTNGNTKVDVIDPTTQAENTYYYQIPETINMGIYVTIRKTLSLPTDYESLIKKAVLANFNGETIDYSRVKMAQVLYASRFYKSVIQTGVNDFVGVELQYPVGGSRVDSIKIPADEIPVLSEDNITVVALLDA